MNISGFFIKRPIFAGVISFIIFLSGLISIFQLPISMYPEVVPPSIVVTAQFPGANPKAIAEMVATPLEEQINGVENMLYMSSKASSDGIMTLTVTFRLGTDPNVDLNLVQNRVDQALPRLPDVTQRIGVQTIKSSADITLVVHLSSPNGRYDMLYLRNYATLNVKDQLAKIEGVGQVQLFGSGDYAMRIWLNPQKIAERELTAAEVVAAVRSQNVPASAGVIGGPPYKEGTEIQVPISLDGRLQTPEQFGEIVIKTDANGVITRLKDVARIQMDASVYGLRSMLDNKYAMAMVIFQLPGSNALDISNHVRATMKELSKSFPDDLTYTIVYDPTVFVRDSIKAVVHTLIEALFMVALVVIVFLQTWRASVIPLLAVPVAIVGTFAVMNIFGGSINVLSLFGLVLAIGIVVDDAIVVVENVERNIESGLAPRDATNKAMTEVTSPIIAITLVLCSVFFPIAFVSGLTGQFYKQFALTIAFSAIISAFNSLTFTPALASLLFKGHGEKEDALTRGINYAFGGFFKRFNHAFERSSVGYGNGIRKIVRWRTAALMMYAALIGLTCFAFVSVPTGFVPAQDAGYLVGFTQLPAGANLDRTERVIRQMGSFAANEPGITHAVQFPGLSINGFIDSPSAGIAFFALDSFDKRKHLTGFQIAQSLQEKFNTITDGYSVVFPPPPVQGLGTIGGFKLEIEDHADLGYEVLDQVVQQVMAKASKAPELAKVFTSYQINTPQLFADLDRTKAEQLDVNLQDVFDAIQIYLGSYYINDFNAYGRTYEVIAEADDDFRSKPDDLLRLKVRNSKGEMVPLGAMIRIRNAAGPETAMRYNAFRAADINGAPAPGYSTGQAQAAMTKILKETLPRGMVFEWTDLTYQQILAGDTTFVVFPICVLLVYLILSAKYESLLLPLAVILIIPLCLLSALCGVHIAGGDNNIFTQISLFVLAALACKNAILIVEFARELETHGRSTLAAAIEGARLRLRPILMTSFAFIMGVLPLVFARGASAEMRQAMGVAVFAGMIGVTFCGLALTPVFYVVLRGIEKLVTVREKPLNHNPPGSCPHCPKGSWI